MVLNPALTLKVLGFKSKTDVTVCDTPAPFTALSILILENFGSTFKTWTCSVPIPRISFSLSFVRSPVTFMCVTIPVTLSAFRPIVVDPMPVRT